MYGYMAQSALLIFLGLVVKGWSSRRNRLGQNRRMALQAELIRLRTVQKMRIRRSVGAMTGNATLFLHGRMLENKGPCCIGVALGTDPALG
jgi:hypothetical protein